MTQSKLGSAKKITIITQQYKMSWGKAESWDAEQIEAWEHDQWLLMQETREDYYKLHRRYDQDSEEEDPFEVEERVKWQEEEERAKT
jgi:hypothetical protein